MPRPGDGAPPRLINRRPTRSFKRVQPTYTGERDMKFKPLGERALVKMVEREEQEAGGIVLPDTAKKKPQTAEVIEVGTGDVVVLRKYAGVEIKLDDEEYLIVDAEELLGVVED